LVFLHGIKDKTLSLNLLLLLKLLALSNVLDIQNNWYLFFELLFCEVKGMLKDAIFPKARSAVCGFDNIQLDFACVFQLIACVKDFALTNFLLQLLLTNTTAQRCTKREYLLRFMEFLDGVLHFEQLVKLVHLHIRFRKNLIRKCDKFFMGAYKQPRCTRNHKLSWLRGKTLLTVKGHQKSKQLVGYADNDLRLDLLRAQEVSSDGKNG
jgi:hypothetical protein